MIHSVRIRGFKRFRDAGFQFPGHVVLTGPNDTGKTTVLQAIASWALAYRRWRDVCDFRRSRGYRRAPLSRHVFVTVPLHSFDLLWLDRRYRGTIEIELRHDAGWSATMEFIADTTEQIYVRPGQDASPDTLRQVEMETVYIPPMTGVGLDEPLLLPPKIAHSLGLGRPGEALRNLLVDVAGNETAWNAVQASIGRLLGCRLLPPDVSAAHILAEYVKDGQEVPLDITSAGSGFRQILLLLSLVHTRPGSVLLLDEPAAHLNPIMQSAVDRELRIAATHQGSQIIAATHSNVLIAAASPDQRIAMQ